MTNDPRRISLQTARRLAVTKQHLAGGLRKGSAKNDLHSVLREIVYVQVDPFSTVVPTHILALWNRVEGFHAVDLDRLLWREKRVFETPPEPVSIALAEDYPLYYTLMKRTPVDPSGWWGGRRSRALLWLETHEELRGSILQQLEGAELTLNQFEGHVKTGRREDGWTSGSDVAVTLQYLHLFGDVMVVGREGSEKRWGRPEDFLPGWFERKLVPESEFERACAQRALRAMGTATRSDIYYYFPRGRYVDLRNTLAALEKEGAIQRVQIGDQAPKEMGYVHSADLPLLDSLERDWWVPRLSLLGPFDNLIQGRQRTNRLFGFDYVHGNYLPAAKRKYGLYVLPILRGDRIIGRLDPRLDRTTRTLTINSVHAEPSAPNGRGVGEEIAESVSRLAKFSGAERVVYTSKVPRAWKAGLGT
ncbi:MAG: YcaQ family DNA glycosylase [Euryarchaeota archaeon]|nr:YcaQ family DNA glycosylase [Euryarchaeota archaeon]MDE1835394.1 YcaQ family DNA glycosylase [Euryarchaeota archaeon]MDE1880497.1 YcaQ family DNA glycosylase [Euryarchaeota archaeon]MDE2043690.1 YcaQ family DNA glycosylase [Thermoplasmata archaeon]